MIKNLRTVLAATSMLGMVTSAVGGTLDAFTFYPTTPSATAPTPVSPISTPVTYSEPAKNKLPALTTYVALNVGDTMGNKLLLTNTSGNTINDVTITLKAWVTDPQEKLTLYNPDFYLKVLKDYKGGTCQWNTDPANEVRITCSVRQLKNADSFPAFTVFFVAPQKVCTPTTDPVDSCGGGIGDTAGSDFVNASLTVVYAEGTAGGNPVENSLNTIAQPKLVELGTSNPKNIQWAVPSDGGKASTGTGGVPDATNKLTELVEIPALPTGSTYTTATINVTEIDANGENAAGCLNQGLLNKCAEYATTIPGTFSPWLKTIYRFDITNLKVTGKQFLNAVLIKYRPDNATKDYDVSVCVNGLPNGLETDTSVTPSISFYRPCVIDKFCYSPAAKNGELAGDCEVQLINRSNGLVKFQ